MSPSRTTLGLLDGARARMARAYLPPPPQRTGIAGRTRIHIHGIISAWHRAHSAARPRWRITHPIQARIITLSRPIAASILLFSTEPLEAIIIFRTPLHATTLHRTAPTSEQMLHF